MLSYQIRFFDRDGRVAHTRQLQCSTDDEALERLAFVRHPYALELWEGDRLVWRFEA